jgi:class 3 adenylate cyclase
VVGSRTVAVIGGWKKGQATMPRASGTSGRARRAAPLRVATLPEGLGFDIDVLVGERPDSAERFLAAVLFTDFEPSTDPFSAIDERPWPDLVAESRCIVGRQAARYDGTLGACRAGGYVRFSGAYSAIRCALAIRKEIHAVGVDLRAGLHAGDRDVHDTDMTEVIAHVASRICGVAGSGRVLVSRPFAGLIAESGLVLQDAGTYRLDDMLGEWRLLAVSE